MRSELTQVAIATIVKTLRQTFLIEVTFQYKCYYTLGIANYIFYVPSIILYMNFL